MPDDLSLPGLTRQSIVKIIVVDLMDARSGSRMTLLG
jgi:hypothetical protein